MLFSSGCGDAKNNNGKNIPGADWRTNRGYIQKEVNDKNGKKIFLLDLGSNYVGIFDYDGSGQALQVLEFEKIADLKYAGEHCEFTDLNGDGYADFRIPQPAKGKISEHRWYYSPEKGIFVKKDKKIPEK